MSVYQFIIAFLYGLEHLNGRSFELRLGSNEKSWHEDMPFNSFGQIRHRKLTESCQNILKKNDFSKQELLRARTFERKVIETWSYRQMKGLGVLMCLLTVITKFGRIPVGKWQKWQKLFFFQNMSICKMFNTPSNRGRLEPIRVNNKCFLLT